MQLEARILRYQAIEAYRERPMIVYATSTRQGLNAQMAGDAIREFIDQIDAIPSSVEEVDLLISSLGGDPLTAWRIMSLLRGRFRRVGALVPFNAFSAATLLALGADEIVLHPHASLGPIDPQIRTIDNGQQVQFAYEDVGAFLKFLTDDVGLTEQSYIAPILDKLFSVVKPVLVGGAKRASDLSTDVGARLLAMHMKPEDRAQAKSIAANLNKSFFSHGDAISRGRARELHLPVAEDDAELEELLWQAYVGIEEYMELRRPFIPLQAFLADRNGRESLYPGTAPAAPGVAPVAPARTGPVEVAYSLIFGLVESPRAASEHRTDGAISAHKNGPVIQCFNTDWQTGWRTVKPGARAVVAPAPTASRAQKPATRTGEPKGELVPTPPPKKPARLQGSQQKGKP